MKSLAVRIIHQIRGDKGSLALILFAPLLVITFVSILLGHSNYRPTIAADTSKLPAALVSTVLSALHKQDAAIVTFPPDGDAVAYLKNNKADVVISFSPTGPTVYLLESDTKTAKAMSAIEGAAALVNPGARMNTIYVYGKPGDTTFDTLGYVFLGIFSFFFVYLISAMALVRERTSGTLERLLMSPIRRSGVMMGYTAGYSLFAIIQSVLLVLYSIFILGMRCAGNPFWIVAVMLLMAIVAVCFGAMVSIFANTELQVVQFVPIILVPQIFFSGLVPLDTIPYGLGNLCYITPVYYGCTAIKKVMIQGGGLGVIWPFLLALLAYALMLNVINTFALKKYRKL